MVRTYKLIAEPLKDGNLKKVVRYVYCTSDIPQENDLKISKAMEEFQSQFSDNEYILRTWEV